MDYYSTYIVEIYTYAVEKKLKKHPKIDKKLFETELLN